MKKNIERIISFVIIAAIVSSSLLAFAEENKIKIVIDGQEVMFDESLGIPFIDENGRTLVPFRTTLETFGASVSWDPSNNTAIARKDDVTIIVPISQKYILKNGVKIETDTAAQLKNGRTYLPIRAVLEAFGCEVSWNQNTNTVLVNSPKHEEKIVFEDKNLESNIRKVIKKFEGDIYPSDVKNIKELTIRSSNIRSLRGIQHFESLERIDIFNNMVRDLEPLRALKRLTFVDFQFNLVDDVNPLLEIGCRYSGYGNPQNNTFVPEEKAEVIKYGFYFEGKCFLQEEIPHFCKEFSPGTGGEFLC